MTAIYLTAQLNSCLSREGYAERIRYSFFAGCRKRDWNDFPSVRTIYPREEEQLVYITTDSHYGNCSVVAVLVVADGQKCLKSRL